jgi:hypothetical protein
MKWLKKGARKGSRAKTQDVATPATSATSAANLTADAGIPPEVVMQKTARTHIGGVPIELLQPVKSLIYREPLKLVKPLFDEEFLKQKKPLFDKVLRGMAHHDPFIRETWHRHFGHKTPFETYDLAMLMSEPPGKKGRPEKSGLAEQDLQLMPEIHRRISAGETLKAVTEAMVELDRLQGGKPSLSAPIRLQRRYREWRKTQKK